MIETEVFNLVDKELCYFLEHGVSLNIGYQTNLNIDSYKAEYPNITALINYCKNRNPTIVWRFGLGFEDSELKNTIPYPWNINIADLIYSACNNYITEADLSRYFDLCRSTVDLILTEKEKRVIQKCGSEKLKLATVDFYKKVMQMFTDTFNFLKIEDNSITYGNYLDPYNVCRIKFTNRLSYAQKRKVGTYISYQLLKYFQKYDPSLTSLMHLNITYYFADNGVKTKSCKEFIIRTKANDWTAIGMDPNSEFVPRIGMKRSNSL